MTKRDMVDEILVALRCLETAVDDLDWLQTIEVERGNVVAEAFARALGRAEGLGYNARSNVKTAMNGLRRCIPRGAALPAAPGLPAAAAFAAGREIVLGVEIFPAVECSTCAGVCMCGDQERALRRIAAGNWPHGPMSEAQRRYCVDEIDSAGEGQYVQRECEAMADQLLASTVLRAWSDYVKSHF